MGDPKDDGAQITEETPAYQESVPTKPPVDPWIELTDAGDEGEVIDALGWEEQSFPPDGPVAAPLDAPPALAPTADLEPPRPRPRLPSMRTRLLDEMEPTHYQQEVRQLLNQPVVVARKTPARQSSGAGRQLTPPPRASSQAKRAASEASEGGRAGFAGPGPARLKAPVRPAIKASPDRRYPKMLALLKDADSVEYGIAPKCAPPPPPVPGTFFPAPRTPLYERPAAQDLDELLATMAEGLLIGESPDGGTEVRVTLKDEFFAGTELRIRVGGGQVSAQLLPPDRDIYWQLNGNLEELRERLASRGLTVAELTVLEP